MYENKVTIRGNKVYDQELLAKASVEDLLLDGGPLETSLLWEFLIPIPWQKESWSPPTVTVLEGVSWHRGTIDAEYLGQLTSPSFFIWEKGGSKTRGFLGSLPLNTNMPVA